MKVRLFTAAGVDEKFLVHEGVIPDFVTGAPQILMWGTRIFVRVDEAKILPLGLLLAEPDPKESQDYKEADFAFYME